ncbi:MAG: hypothetical protein PHI12_11100 [Dehalococcoidales bacterium]|nr:hypothetical protein [Candidatus Thermoplasmatota archaeon]MDD5511335.1 hypothetical protein [Dehalococcoidales bacterium]
MKMIRVSDETHKRLVQTAGRLMEKRGEHVSLTNAIDWLLDREEGR